MGTIVQKLRFSARSVSCRLNLERGKRQPGERDGCIRETAASERNSRVREKWPRQRPVAGYPGSRGCQRAPENADRWKAEEKCTGISTIEREFLSNIVLPDGQTVGEWMAPQLETAYTQGNMPALLPMLEDCNQNG